MALRPETQTLHEAPIMKGVLLSSAFLLPVLSTAAIASAGTSRSPTRSTRRSCAPAPTVDAGAADRCDAPTDVDACLAIDGCAGGDSGEGLQCFYIGTVVPEIVPTEPCPEPPTPKTSTATCEAQTDAESCLAVGTCAWGTTKRGEECIDVGVLAPE